MFINLVQKPPQVICVIFHCRHTAGHTAIRIQCCMLNHENTASQFLIYFLIILIFIPKLLNNNVDSVQTTPFTHIIPLIFTIIIVSISHIINIIIVIIKCRTLTQTSYLILGVQTQILNIREHHQWTQR